MGHIKMVHTAVMAQKCEPAFHTNIQPALKKEVKVLIVGQYRKKKKKHSCSDLVMVISSL